MEKGLYDKVDQAFVTLLPVKTVGVMGDQRTYTMQNSSGKEVDFNTFEFKLLVPSGAITDATIFGSDNLLSSGKLIDGGSTSGDVCFDADMAAGGQFVVIYEPLSFFSNHREAWVNNL